MKSWLARFVLRKSVFGENGFPCIYVLCYVVASMRFFGFVSQRYF
jgi:hypothetical protein